MIEILSKKTTASISLDEENILDWKEVLKKSKITFGNDIYESWIKNVSLKKEYNHYVILSAPTRFVRDWIVSRYVDKILDIIKTFKKSIQRIEFFIDEAKDSSKQKDFQENAKVTSIDSPILNYNRFNRSNSFDNFIVGESNELAYTAARQICIQ